MYPLRAEKPGLHPNLACVLGDRGCRNPIPGMLRKPGDLPQVCPRPKKFERLATRDTLHGSRPNLRQREPDGRRIVPTPPDVSDEGASTKRCARREKKYHNYTYIYVVLHRYVYILISTLYLVTVRSNITRVCLVRYRYSRYRYGCTELTEVSGTGIDAVPNLPKCPVPVLGVYRTY